MAVRDKQRLIIDIVGDVLGIKAEENKSFDWLKNQHSKECFFDYYRNIDDIFTHLKGTFEAKRSIKLQCDAYFGGIYNFICEFDEMQHFSTARQHTFSFYPQDIQLNYSLESWLSLCKTQAKNADGYRKNKTTSDFNFIGGRTNQRAYFDCFRDFLPGMHGLNPTLRICEFEVGNIFENNAGSRKIIEHLLKNKLRKL